MKMTVLALLLAVSALPSLAAADLDLDREVLVIPDTHDAKPYVWQVRQDPREYSLNMAHEQVPGQLDRFRFSVAGPSGIMPSDLHVFITDDDLQTFAHIRPQTADGVFAFAYAAPASGSYRIEVVFRTDSGWVELRRDIRLEKNPLAAGAVKPGDGDYDVSVKFYPRKVYADHVVTFLYQLSYKGMPLTNVEKVAGADMQVAAWDEDLKEFIYMTPRQNLGGPDVGVSVVFHRPGRHKVFAEFLHNGVVRRVDFVLAVYAEPPQLEGTMPAIRPAD